MVVSIVMRETFLVGEIGDIKVYLVEVVMQETFLVGEVGDLKVFLVSFFDWR